MKVYVEEMESPAGRILFAVDEGGDLTLLKFAEGDYEKTAEEELERLGFEIHRDPEKTAKAREQLDEYVAGERRAFDLPLSFIGSEWQKAVWGALTRIPYGETRSYGEIAAMIGHPKAARAVGRANATNRIPLVVPCHRVIGANGKLTGFAGGMHLKTRLLEHERRVLDEAGSPGLVP